MNNRQLTLSFAVALALASPTVSAMGLGQLQVKSGLNQPLVAEIPIISATPSELEQLDVRLASPEAFARIGLEPPGELTANLHFTVADNARGQPVIRITTPGRFSEPVLSFLIEAEWGKGTVTREYTALIDPPYIAPAVIQPMLAPTIAEAPAPIAPPVSEPAPPEPAPAAEPEPTATVPPPAPRPVVETPPAPAPRQPAAPRPPAEQTAAAPSPPAEKPAAPAPAPRPAATPSPATAPGKYGPVAAGQTLWAIANSVRPDAGVSVNQMMVALLRANPEAFAQDNINRLKSGSVLRVPGQDEVSRLSAAEASALVSQQASAWRAPRQPVPQPAESAAAGQDTATVPAPTPNTAKVASSKPRNSSRLEIVPPSGDAKARGAQSGAAAGAGGSELRAELVQAREELAARSSEVTELKSRVAELQKQEGDRQHLIEMQNSQLKDLQDRLKQMEAEQAVAATAAAAAPAPGPAPVAAAKGAAPAAEATPDGAGGTHGIAWYLNPFVLGGTLLVMLGGLVLVMRRSKPKADSAEPSRNRLSDDEALRTTMAKARAAGERIKSEPSMLPASSPATPIIVVPEEPVDAELAALKEAVQSRPQDIEAHLSLLRLYHARGNAVEYEEAAEAMRAQVPSTMDPRWREAVIMGASLLPGHALFNQAGWNSPRFNESDVSPRPAVPSFVAAAEPEASAEPVAEPAGDIEPPTDFGLGAADEAAEAPTSVDFDLDEQGSMFGGFDKPPMDIHRSEAELMVEDESSATRIELAKAYLDIGDLDGARSMLEEVLAEGGPAAQAEAARLLKELG